MLFLYKHTKNYCLFLTIINFMYNFIYNFIELRIKINNFEMYNHIHKIHQ